MHKGFAWNRKCIFLAAKRPGFLVSVFSEVSVFSDTSSARIDLFLSLVDAYILKAIKNATDTNIFVPINGNVYPFVCVFTSLPNVQIRFSKT